MANSFAKYPTTALPNAQFAKFSMGICDFWPIGSDTLGRLFEITYGGKWPSERVKKVGERIFNLQRMFNVMAGFTRNDDKLPERLHKEVLRDGAPTGIIMPKDAFEKEMEEYYSCRSWDEQGRPTIEKLKELNIEEKLIDVYKKTLNG